MWSIFDPENKELLEDLKRQTGVNDGDIERLKKECQEATDKINKMLGLPQDNPL